MLGKGRKCKKCKSYFHYKQIQGIRLKELGDDNKYYYDRYCPKCKTYSKERVN